MAGYCNFSFPARKQTQNILSEFLVLFTCCVFRDGNPIHKTYSVSVLYSDYSADRRNIENDFPCCDRTRWKGKESQLNPIHSIPSRDAIHFKKYHALRSANQTNVKYMSMNFMVAQCINNIKHFIVQLMHTNYKILRLLK